LQGQEPRGQKLLAYGLLGALVIVVVGSLLGEFAGIRDLNTSISAAFGKPLLTIGLFFWVIIL
jgi:nitric oxide reductase subunit B